MSADEIVPNCPQCRLYFEENGSWLTIFASRESERKGQPVSAVREFVSQHMAAIHTRHKAAQS